MEWENQQVMFGNVAMLRGTLTIPITENGSLPAILLLGGSGKLNRDGNAIRGKFQFNIYRELAEHLSERGFVTLRYDKRGVGQSEGIFETSGLWDAVNDAEQALEFLAGHPKVDPNRLIVLGHSEGCIVGTALNEKRPVNGLIFLSGGGAGLEESLAYQRQLLYEEMKKETGLKGFLIDKLKTVEKSEKKTQDLYAKLFSTDKDLIRLYGFIKMPAKYFREHFAYDMIQGLQKIACPVLAIDGTKDFHTSFEYLKRFPEHASGSVTCVVIDNMDHGLKEQLKPMSISNFKKDYIQNISKPIHPQLLHHLDTWLGEHSHLVKETI
ncbi:alpha/beta fold hydrolase [Sporosarcina sp. 179-K 3D1 HS]|uniref:alpha/beta hydrolase n=1 Tax=Sporosarcina sp. 179-K 3D1 HS TaxID=3232169 RepID=UPI00399F286B